MGGSFVSYLCIQGTLDFPYKAPVYATLIGLLNHRRSDFGTDFMRRLSDEMGAAIKGSKIHTAKLLLRLLAEMVNASVVVPSSFVTFLKQLTTASEKADSAN